MRDIMVRNDPPSVVGYNTQAVQGDKLYCIGLQFADVGVAGDLASIAKLSTSGVTPGAYDTMATAASLASPLKASYGKLSQIENDNAR